MKSSSADIPSAKSYLSQRRKERQEKKESSLRTLRLGETIFFLAASGVRGSVSRVFF
jgi:hypothetical protein